MKIECEFETLKNGRVQCKTHEQDLFYLFSNGIKICQVGEDELVSKIGHLGKYVKWVSEQKLPFLIGCKNGK